MVVYMKDRNYSQFSEISTNDTGKQHFTSIVVKSFVLNSWIGLNLLYFLLTLEQLSNFGCFEIGVEGEKHWSCSLSH
jgi:hypothetical protein